ncbi:Glyoxylate/hydroxypyruvate reductase B [Anaerobiospirillum thomasii]|uniref:Glyoxylate/hydroxypyruvate reductase B n=2 Tax=Anaerobiospirillum thomasii TaxID=179995 RepID=A0A2X0VAP4_9GAMM|nr:2-hydroxyacid dehydrogenase [Anaerobiospirillum thomasii]SPT69833.1 Glyoxylate/hydroxypyruvate reductase B [Anaerobiospirillum thomasii]SPT71564.1 Glyoxylate/hydroxypyruvate reductase B [Anaerobiospirillum thomasii]
MSEKVRFLNMANQSLPQWLLQEVGRRGEVKNKRDLDKDELYEYMQHVDIVLASGGSTITADDIKAMPKLRLITDCAVGYDKIDVAACKEHGVHVTHTPGVLNNDVADLAVGLLINVTRSLVAAHKYIENGNWGKTLFPLSTSMSDLKVGLAGIGSIGQEIAKRLEPFKTHIGYFARHRHDDLPYTYFEKIVDLAQWCDALIIIMPASKDNYHIVDDKVLDALKDGFLINVGRGSLVDTQALIDALESGHIKGVALDVFENEPHVPSSFLHMDNVVITPHIGSATQRTRRIMGQMVLDNIDAFLSGRELVNEVKETRS